MFMQSYRVSTKVPKPNTLIKLISTTSPSKQKMPYYACVPRQSRQSFFPRQSQFLGNDLAPLFRLFDEATNEILNAAATPAVRTFQPRFDVKEEKERFLLHGELPGISQENINIEFVDQNTLVVHGRSVSERSAAPAAENGTVEKQIESAEEKSETGSTHQPTVEDDVDEDDYSTISRPSSVTPAASTETVEATELTEKPATKEQALQKQQPKSKYWINERSIGEFHRSFQFPGQIDQENVTASLKDGILNVIVPKAVLKEPRKIVVN